MREMLREFLAACGQNMAAAKARPRNTVLIAAGFLIAAITLLGMLTIPAGMAKLAGHTGRADIAVVKIRASPSRALDGLTQAEQIAMLGNIQGVAYAKDGTPLVAPQFVATVKLYGPAGDERDVTLRGITPVFWQVIGGQLPLLRGQYFKSGLREVIAGSSAMQSLANIRPGVHLVMHHVPWQVAGIFDAGTSMWGFEIWTDMKTAQDVWHASGVVTSVWVRLTSAAAFETFVSSVAANGSLHDLSVYRQSAYYQAQLGFVYRFASAMAWGVAIVLGLGSMLAIANALGMSLAARRRDTAVLRALGFRRSTLALAMLMEVLVMGAVCTMVAAVLGWLTLNGRAFDTTAGDHAVAIPLIVNASVVALTMLFALVLGVLAAVGPIWRAVRAPLSAALHEE